MEDLSSGSSDYAASTWIAWFLSTKGNEYYCEVDEDYILDRFNLTGLNAEVQHYMYALDLITDALDDHINETHRDQIETQARILYGLIHARYIITSRGLAKMTEKFKRADFGRCPRVLCYQQPLLPMGLSDNPFQSPVRLYCPRCEDLYRPKSSRHGAVDGAFFGSTFPHMLLMVYPHLIPAKTLVTPAPMAMSLQPKQYGGISANELHRRAVDLERRTGNTLSAGEETDSSAVMSRSAMRPSDESKTDSPKPQFERVVPRIFGFPVHETSRLMAWQDRQQALQERKRMEFWQQKQAK